jgi:hypothetical protein
VKTLDHNAIFARWLQRRAQFVADGAPSEPVWGRGGAARARGPDTQELVAAVPASAAPRTGHFVLYDTDFTGSPFGATLLFTSESVTVSPGDVWQLVDN